MALGKKGRAGDIAGCWGIYPAWNQLGGKGGRLWSEQLDYISHSALLFPAVELLPPAQGEPILTHTRLRDWKLNQETHFQFGFSCCLQGFFYYYFFFSFLNCLFCCCPSVYKKHTKPSLFIFFLIKAKGDSFRETGNILFSPLSFQQ